MLFGKRKQIVKRILIVEDEPLTAFDNENFLGDAGYEVVATVDDLDEALAVLERDEVISSSATSGFAATGPESILHGQRKRKACPPYSRPATPIPKPHRSRSAAS